MVIFANSANGLAIAPEIAALALGTEAPGLGWLSYDRYDSPVRQALRRIVAGDSAGIEALLAPFAEAEVNSLGYRLLARGRAADAVRVLRHNAVRFPASANTHDSLGEALLAVGDSAGAIASYRRAAELGSEGSAAVFRRLTSPAVQLPSALLDAYAGTYRTPMGPLVVTRDAGGLSGTLGDEGAARLVPESSTRFRVGASSSVEFIAAPDGRVTQAIIRAGGQEIRAPRVSPP